MPACFKKKKIWIIQAFAVPLIIHTVSFGMRKMAVFYLDMVDSNECHFTDFYYFGEKTTVVSMHDVEGSLLMTNL